MFFYCTSEILQFPNRHRNHEIRPHQRSGVRRRESATSFVCGHCVAPEAHFFLRDAALPAPSLVLQRLKDGEILRGRKGNEGGVGGGAFQWAREGRERDWPGDGGHRTEGGGDQREGVRLVESRRHDHVRVQGMLHCHTTLKMLHY